MEKNLQIKRLSKEFLKMIQIINMFVQLHVKKSITNMYNMIKMNNYMFKYVQHVMIQLQIHLDHKEIYSNVQVIVQVSDQIYNSI